MNKNIAPDNSKPLAEPSLIRALISLELALIDLSSKEAKQYIENAIKDIEYIKTNKVCIDRLYFSPPDHQSTKQ